MSLYFSIDDLRSGNRLEQWAASEIQRLQRLATAETERFMELRAILALLPKDAQCNAVYPGRELVSTYCDSIQQPRIVMEIREHAWRFCGSGWYIEGDDVRPCYGSVEAAEKARNQSNG